MFYHVTLTLNFDIVVYLLSIYYEIFFYYIRESEFKAINGIFWHVQWDLDIDVRWIILRL